MPDSLQPYGFWSVMFLCPWNYPGKNTLLQGELPDPHTYLTDPGVEPASPVSLTLQVDSF